MKLQVQTLSLQSCSHSTLILIFYPSFLTHPLPKEQIQTSSSTRSRKQVKPDRCKFSLESYSRITHHSLILFSPFLTHPLQENRHKRRSTKIHTSSTQCRDTKPARYTGASRLPKLSWAGRRWAGLLGGRERRVTRMFPERGVLGD